MSFSIELLERLRAAKVVVGFSVEKLEHAVPLASALVAGGLNVIELTLRTPVAIDALRVICQEVPEVIAGVGTILTPGQVTQVKDAGAAFGVSPGLNSDVVRAASAAGCPFAPRIATPSEIEAAVSLGCRFVKFFPAGACGGIKYLRSVSALYRHLGIQYFPLGGVNADNMVEYLAQEDVPVVGGSWVARRDLVEDEDWASITKRAQKAANRTKEIS